MQHPLTLGRYTLFCELAAGGMATVYLGRASGAVGFGRTVAVKRLHPHLARDPELVSRFVDEARLVARVHHPNVVPTLDVVAQDGEIFLVLEYVKGESLAGLLRTSVLNATMIPVPVALSVMTGVLNGLHAAHEARDEKGEPLHIVHRDISPQNVMVGVDGIARVLDFGVAKAVNRMYGTTRDGQLKGKVPYMPPEQISGSATRQTDVYSAGVVLWETLACRGLFRYDNELQLLQAVLSEEIAPPSTFNPRVPAEVDRITMKALARDPAQRYASAHQMAEDIDACALAASSMKVAEWVQLVAGSALTARSALVAQVESGVALTETQTTDRPSVVTVPSVTLKPHASPEPSPPRAMPARHSVAAVSLIAASLAVGGFLMFRSNLAAQSWSAVPEVDAEVAQPKAPAAPDAAPPPRGETSTASPPAPPPPPASSLAAAASTKVTVNPPKSKQVVAPPGGGAKSASDGGRPMHDEPIPSDVPAGLATGRHE